MNAHLLAAVLMAALTATTPSHAQSKAGAGAETATRAAVGSVAQSYMQGLAITALMVVAVAQGGSSTGTTNTGTSGTTGTR